MRNKQKVKMVQLVLQWKQGRKFSNFKLFFTKNPLEIRFVFPGASLEENNTSEYINKSQCTSGEKDIFLIFFIEPSDNFDVSN